MLYLRRIRNVWNPCRVIMVEDFVTYLRYEKHRSEKTVEAYHDDLRAFEVFFKQLDGGLSWKSVDADVIREWIGSMMDRGNAVS